MVRSHVILCVRFVSLLNSLENYPQQELFSGLQRKLSQSRVLDCSLSGHLTRFLQQAGDKDRDCSDLAWPLSVIRNKIQETSRPVISLTTRDTLRRFISKLLRIVKKNDGSIKEEAAKCLAEIGPVDLTSEILEDEIPTTTDLIPTLLKHLVDILVNSSGDLSTRATQALINILSHTEEGRVWVRSREEDSETDLRQFLVPFRRQKTNCGQSGGFSPAEFSCRVDRSELWESQTSSHQEWISSLVTALLATAREGSVYSFLADTCRMSQSLCDKILPFILNDMITNSTDDISVSLSLRICKFFEDHFDRGSETVRTGSGETEFPFLRKESLLVMLSAVLHIRQVTLSDNCWQENFKITNINYLHCATAAFYCGEHFSALLMCQIWCLKEGITNSFGTDKNDFGESLLERIACQRGPEARKIQEIMFSASREIGDSDVALGVGRMMVEDPTSRICQLSLEGRSGSALPLSDALVVRGGRGSSGLVAGLQSQGLLHTLHQLLSSGPGLGDQFRAEQQECCWRLER